MSTHTIGVIGILAIALMQVANADTTIVFRTSENNDEASRMEITERYIRVDANDGKTRAFMLFDQTKNHMLFVNDSEQSYMIFDQEQIQKVAAMQQQMMAQLDAQMAALPAAQRERMKEMMRSRMGGAIPGGESQPRRYERTGNDRVGEYACEVLVVYAGERKAAEQCVVTRSKLGIPDADFATMRAMQQFAADIASQFAIMSEQVVEYGEPGRDEVPVRFTHYSSIAGNTTGELDTIHFDTIDTARFAIPAGYKVQKIPDLGR